MRPKNLLICLEQMEAVDGDTHAPVGLVSRVTGERLQEYRELEDLSGVRIQAGLIRTRIEIDIVQTKEQWDANPIIGGRLEDS